MKVLVVGAGTMGHGIAEVCALAGFETFLVDLNENILESARMKIGWSLRKLVEKGKISDPLEVLNRIKTSTDLPNTAKQVDFVIEAVVERTEVKKEVFKTLDENCKTGVILSTNTSTIPITEIAKATKREEEVIGLHFFNPPTLIRFVEIVKGEKTSNETVKRTVEFTRKIGMDYIVVEKDVPGFVVNRINVRIAEEAIKMIESGFKAEEIDSAIRFRIGMPMGLLEVLDFSGVDVTYNVMREVSKRGMEVEIPKLLEEMVKEGRLGMKSGKGFYEYEGFYSRAKISPKLAYRVNPLRILAQGVNEACWLIRNGVSTKEDIDKAMVHGMGYPRGLLELADEYGLDNLSKFLAKPDELMEKMIKENKLGKKSGEGFYKWKYEKVAFGGVVYEKRGNYAMITMNRADKLNALNEDMWNGLREAFLKAEKDEEIRVVVITGKGRAFCAGDDIAVMGSWREFFEGKKFFENVASPLIETLANYKKPIVSLVNGIAFGGGLELNLFFDVVIASENATFAVPEGLIGAIPPIASSLGVATIGKRLIRYCLTGEQIDAEEAKQLGIVDLVVKDEELEITGVEFVNKLMNIAPLSAKAIKEILRVYRESFKAVLEKGMHEIIELIPTKDFGEGMKAFSEKRRPKWEGK